MHLKIFIVLSILLISFFIYISLSKIDKNNLEFKFLDVIGFENSISNVNLKKEIIIAVIDTGVDFNHSYIKNYLLKGKNLIDDLNMAQDINGHGTNIAGIIVSFLNKLEDKKINIMPIKVTNTFYNTNELELVEGFYYAINHGANIISLSVSLDLPPPKLKEALIYAENNNVLVVAAAGNGKTSVKFPAALPTVIAVGGANNNGSYDGISNYGNGLNIVAPSNVYTTSLGGGFSYQRGTSMAAPQVAAIAAILLSMEPNLKPYELREILTHATKDIGKKGWDEYTGFGLLLANKVLLKQYKLYTNTTKADADFLQLGKMAYSHNYKNGTNWFTLSVPNNGELELIFELENPLTSVKTDITIYQKEEEQDFVITESNTLKFNVKPGKIYIRVKSKSKIYYNLITYFHIHSDQYEKNDSFSKSYELNEGNNVIIGTLHSEDDIDWFKMKVISSGNIDIEVFPKSRNLDPEIIYNQQGNSINKNISGENENVTFLVSPGNYFFAIKNVLDIITNSEYELHIDYTRVD